MSLLARTAFRLAAAALAFAALAPVASAQEKVLNLYSARHYQTDEALYDNFTKATGIRINRVEADDAGILARLKAEGAASPADVILLVDAARLWRGEQEGLCQPVKSALLAQRIPEQFRGGVSAQGVQWWGLSTRGRVVVYDKSRLKASDVDTYEKLGTPALKGQLCVRSGSHPYNLSLFGSMLEHLGPQGTEAWLKGLVSNMARSPKGGDTDQIRGVAAKNREAAVQFIEYLASDSAQSYFADGNNEYPVVPSVPMNPALAAMGKFKAETVPIAKVGANAAQVQQMLDRVGFK